MAQSDSFTLIPFMYRDANNYKVSGVMVAEGTITDDQIAQLRDAFDGGVHFVAEQVDVQHLGWASEWPSFPHPDDDHSWHEVNLAGIVVATSDATAGWGPRRDVGSIDTFVASVAAAAEAGWDAERFDPSHTEPPVLIQGRRSRPSDLLPHL